MSSLSDFQLYWSDDRSPGSDTGTPCQQYVFETHVEQQFSLHRVRSVQDALSLLSGSRRSADWFAVAGAALLYGNLAATGQWLLLLTFAFVGLLIAVWELRAAAAFSAVTLAGLLLETLRQGGVSLHWLAAVGIQVLLALAALIVGLHLVQEDPRSYVLVREEDRPGADRGKVVADQLGTEAGVPSKALRPGQLAAAGAGDEGGVQDVAALPHICGDGCAIIRNRCCMDIKLLVFDGDDFVRLIPHGGLLGGTLLARGASCCLGCNPPYMVKAYAPWEIELGTFLVSSGAYNFRATAPPLALVRSGEQRFTNATEAPVRICVCSADCWCCSLWLPLAPQMARLARGTTLVPPGADVALAGPCTLRVYDAHLPSGLLQRACARLRPGERAEFLGSVRWTPARSSVGRSCSSLFSAIS